MQIRAISLRLCLALWLGALIVFVASPAPAMAGPFDAPKDKALVYVILGPSGSFANLPVSVNGRPLQYLTENSYFAFVVSPGTQEISTAAAARTAVSLVVGSGRTYYLRISVDTQDVPEIVQLGDTVGEEALTQARRMGDSVVGASNKQATAASAARTEKRSAAPEPVRERAVSANDDMPNTIIIKGGTHKLSKGTQTFLSATHTFDTKSTSVFGVEYEYRAWEGVAVGAEYGQFKNSFTSSTTSVASSIDTKMFLVKFKKYFEYSDIFQPYVGIGAGTAWTDFGGAITGNTIGGAYEAVGGMDFRFKHIGVYTELRYLSAKTSGKESGTDNTADVHVTGSGAFAGVSIHF